MQRPVPTQLTTKERKRRALEETIASVAKLFPATFAAERQRPHKPLKLGIRLDIIERGVLMPTECCRALARYCTRRAYQVALATGGARFELDGTPSGEATAAEQQAARDAIARMDALRNERAAAAKATFKAEANSEATPAAKPNLKLVPAPRPCWNEASRLAADPVKTSRLETSSHEILSGCLERVHLRRCWLRVVLCVRPRSDRAASPHPKKTAQT